jgi:soluble lytic murein transglycosylase-like protein
VTRRQLHAIVGTGGITVVALLVVAGWLIANRPQSPGAPRRTFANHVHLIFHPEPATPPARVAPAALGRRSSYSALISAAAQRHNVSPQLVAAIARVESDYRPHLVSHKGARGIMQVIPETGLRFGVQPHELFDPERNLSAGTAYMAWLLRRYDGNVDLALAGYNAGEGAVDKYRGIPPYRETQEYVRKVRRELARLGS